MVVFGYNFVILNRKDTSKNRNFFKIETSWVRYNLQHVQTRNLNFAKREVVWS